MNKKKFVIIDAMAMAYKAYFAFVNRPLINSKGEPTSAVYGFISQLLRIIEETKPNYLAVAFDSKEKTFRHEIFDQYKATRLTMPDDMIPQINRIKEIVQALNFQSYIKPGFEADDIIGTAVKLAEKLGIESFAVTPDKDYVQLVTDNIKLIKTGKSTDELIITDHQKVIDEYGFEPKFMIDYLALVGDTSDNIPGVTGIGPKSAQPLISKFGTIENIYDNLEKIEKVAIKTKLENGKDQAFLSKKLATIVNDVDIKFNFEEELALQSRLKSPDFNKVKSIFEELEFKSFYDRLLKIFDKENSKNLEDFKLNENKVFDKQLIKYHLITTKEDAENLAKLLANVSEFVFDTETDSLDTLSANLAGVSFCLKPREAYFVGVNPFIEQKELFVTDLSDRLSIRTFTDIFKPIFENENIRKICQNGKYDISVLKTYNINLNGFYFDTMLASYCIDPDQKHGMDALAQKYLNYSPISLTEIIGEKKEAEKIFSTDLQKLSDYSCEDADITFQLYLKFKDIIKNENLDFVAYKIEFPLVEVLEKMERDGVKIDKEGLKDFSKELEFSINNLKNDIYRIAGETFNINSTKQLQSILFEKLKLNPPKKTQTGFSTDAKSLEIMANEHEIIEHLINYRQLTKLKSTYSDSLPKLVNSKTGKIHTTYNQTVASTGRLSSLNPNLQNIPIRTELGKEIRKAFIPSDKNHLILSADYSQIELRIMAHLSKDEVLIKAFKNNEDIHRSTAALVFSVKPGEVTSDMRRKAKEVNFGILYGIGAFGLASRLGIPRNHAQEVIDTYFNTFKNVKGMMDNFIQTAREKGFAETIIGRRRFLNNINSKNRTVRQFEERVAINMPIQGTAADLIKIAMINIFNEFKKLNVKSKMILQVHDELVFDVLKDELNELKPLIKETMENAMKFNVPITVDTGVGNNWLEAH